PLVAIGIAHAVFALAVGLVARFRQELGAGGAGVREMRIDIGNMNDEAGAFRRLRCRMHAVIRRDAMQPDRLLAEMHFAMDNVALPVAVETTVAEAKRPHEKGLRRSDVATGEYRYDLVRRHACLPFKPSHSNEDKGRTHGRHEMRIRQKFFAELA